MNAYDKALSLIKIRPHYSQELAKKLALRGFKREQIQEVINRLIESGLLDDAHFTEVFLDSLIRFKLFGFYGLKAKLMQRGIESHDAENFLKDRLSLSLEQEIAERFLNKQSETDKTKLAQKLARRGFRNEIIRKLTY